MWVPQLVTLALFYLACVHLLEGFETLLMR
jgi:hypothetical protein